MGKHTEGPWHIANGIQVRSEKHQVAKVWMFGHGTGEANARLIAAAPDLLEVAQLALQIAESWIHDQLDGTSSLDGALRHLEPVRAAIAKAKGEQ